MSLLDLTTGYFCGKRAGDQETHGRLAGNQAFLPAALWPRALLCPIHLLDPILTPDFLCLGSRCILKRPTHIDLVGGWHHGNGI